MSQEVPNEFDQEVWLRITHIVGDKKSTPPIEPIVRVSKSTIYRWISEGIFPKPSKPTPGTSLWKKSKVMRTLNNFGGE